MNITRDVITDLWPVYAAGEASQDTRALVEEFIRQDPEFGRMLQENADEDLLKPVVSALPPDHQAKTFNRTKKILQGYDWLLFFAMLWSGFAFGRIISDTSFDVSPLNFIITAAIALVFWIAYFARMAWIRRKVYKK